MDMLSGFSWESAYVRYQITLRISVLSGSTLAADLPAAIDVYTLQPELPFPGRTVTSPSPRRSMSQCRNINRLFHRSRRSAEP